MNGFDLSTISAAYLGSTAISEIYYGSTKIWPAGAVTEPLTFTLKSVNTTIKWVASNASVAKTIEYRIDNGEWTSVTSTTSGATISGGWYAKKIQFRGDNTAYATSNYYNYFTVDSDFTVSGNIMSLFSSTDFASMTTLPAAYALKELFHECTTLTDASQLSLPATTLSDYCYYNMFYGCTNMTAIPALPATTLTQYCYYQMFYNCSSITDAPMLSATTLAASCYRGMFNGCSSLKTTQAVLPATNLTEACYRYMYYGCTDLLAAPELPAETLASQSYFYMFYNCKSLSYIKCLAVNTSANNCTYEWVSNVASTGVFVKNPSKTNWSNGISGIPVGWTTVNDAQGIIVSSQCVLLDEAGGTKQITVTSSSPWTATTNSDWITISPSSSSTASTTVSITTPQTEGTKRMGTIVFSDGNIETVVSVLQRGYEAMLLTFDILGGGTIGWRAQNSSLTKTIQYRKNGGNWTSITSTTSGVTFSVANGDVVQFRGDNTAYGNASYYNRFTATCQFKVRGNIMSLINSTSFSSLTTLSDTGALRTLFYQNTYLIDASELLLPATTLSARCYQGLFNGCTNLTAVPVLPAATLASNAYNNLFNACSSLTYIKCLATDISASNCTSNWVNGVAATGTFVKASSMSSWTTGNNGIPSGWTVEDAS